MITLHETQNLPGHKLENEKFGIWGAFRVNDHRSGGSARSGEATQNQRACAVSSTIPLPSQAHHLRRWAVDHVELFMVSPFERASSRHGYGDCRLPV